VTYNLGRYDVHIRPEFLLLGKAICCDLLGGNNNNERLRTIEKVVQNKIKVRAAADPVGLSS
jgi:hypothetical protein